MDPIARRKGSGDPVLLVLVLSAIMAAGRIIIFREDRNDKSRRFGYIADDANGPWADRALNAYFDERDLVDCEPSEIDAPFSRATFDYGAQGGGRNPRARNVRLIQLPEKIGTVKTIKRYSDSGGFYGFIAADDRSSLDYYFSNQAVADPYAVINVGDRVRFRYDVTGDNKPRASRVELVEEE